MLAFGDGFDFFFSEISIFSFTFRLRSEEAFDLLVFFLEVLATVGEDSLVDETLSVSSSRDGPCVL